MPSNRTSDSRDQPSCCCCNNSHQRRDPEPAFNPISFLITIVIAILLGNGIMSEQPQVTEPATQNNNSTNDTINSTQSIKPASGGFTRIANDLGYRATAPNK